MQTNTLVKLVIAAVVILFLWKQGLPWLARHQAQSNPEAARPSGTSSATNCVFEARAASDLWSGSIGRFTNPPYDMQAWNNLMSQVQGRIGRAEQKCSCDDDACKPGRQAMDDLRSVVNEMDSAIRGNAAPPLDIVQRQERIDNALDEATAAAEKHQ